MHPLLALAPRLGAANLSGNSVPGNHADPKGFHETGPGNALDVTGFDVTCFRAKAPGCQKDLLGPRASFRFSVVLPKFGAREHRYSGERRRWRIMARLLVVEPYFLPVAFITPATNSESALPMPTPWKSGRQTVRCFRQKLCRHALGQRGRDLYQREFALDRTLAVLKTKRE